MLILLARNSLYLGLWKLMVVDPPVSYMGKVFVRDAF